MIKVIKDGRSLQVNPQNQDLQAFQHLLFSQNQVLQAFQHLSLFPKVFRIFLDTIQKMTCLSEMSTLFLPAHE